MKLREKKHGKISSKKKKCLISNQPHVRRGDWYKFFLPAPIAKDLINGVGMAFPHWFGPDSIYCYHCGYWKDCGVHRRIVYDLDKNVFNWKDLKPHKVRLLVQKIGSKQILVRILFSIFEWTPFIYDLNKDKLYLQTDTKGFNSDNVDPVKRTLVSTKLLFDHQKLEDYVNNLHIPYSSKADLHKAYQQVRIIVQQNFNYDVTLPKIYAHYSLDQALIASVAFLPNPLLESLINLLNIHEKNPKTVLLYD